MEQAAEMFDTCLKQNISHLEELKNQKLARTPQKQKLLDRGIDVYERPSSCPRTNTIHGKFNTPENENNYIRKIQSELKCLTSVQSPVDPNSIQPEINDLKLNFEDEVDQQGVALLREIAVNSLNNSIADNNKEEFVQHTVCASCLEPEMEKSESKGWRQQIFKNELMLKQLDKKMEESLEDTELNMTSFSHRLDKMYRQKEVKLDESVRKQLDGFAKHEQDMIEMKGKYMDLENELKNALKSQSEHDALREGEILKMTNAFDAFLEKQSHVETRHTVVVQQVAIPWFRMVGAAVVALVGISGWMYIQYEQQILYKNVY